MDPLPFSSQVLEYRYCIVLYSSMGTGTWRASLDCLWDARCCIDLGARYQYSYSTGFASDPYEIRTSAVPTQVRLPRPAT